MSFNVTIKQNKMLAMMNINAMLSGSRGIDFNGGKMERGKTS
jgi:hypothetical protein